MTLLPGRISKAMKAFEVQDNKQKKSANNQNKANSQIIYKQIINFLGKILKIGKVSLNNYFCLL